MKTVKKEVKGSELARMFTKLRDGVFPVVVVLGEVARDEVLDLLV